MLIKRLCLADFFFLNWGDFVFKLFFNLMRNGCSGSDDWQVVIKEERDVVYSKLFSLSHEKKYVIIHLESKIYKAAGNNLSNQVPDKLSFYPELGS